MPDIDVPPSPILAAVDLDTPSEPAIDQTKTPYYKEICRVLKDVFQLDRFRHHQLEAMNATMDKQDVFVLMPTGGGKSLCYQLPAVCHSGKTDGVTIVVSPLIALMVDQVTHLKAKGVDAELFNSDQDSDISRVVRQRLLGAGRKPRLIYVTPEKLAHSNDMQNILRKLYQDGFLARFVIDEAHTISTWGRDFRDAYAQLKRLRIDYPETPIMALTATANAQIKQDIMTVLDIPKCLCLEQSFNRPNLDYEIRKKGKTVVSDIANYIKENYKDKTGIVYCFSRNKCEEVAAQLRNNHGIKAKHYHAQLSPSDKQRTQQDWQSGKCQVIVATIAFGMGIDKADVRFVIHHQLPKTMDGYYQETGRAGRDGNPASCILYFSFHDTRFMFKLIEENKDQCAQDEVKRQIEGVLEVARYCFNVTDCRRKLILNHFSQSFDPKDCHKKCDTCRADFQVENEDMTVPTQQLLELVDSINKNHVGPGVVSKTTCMDVFRGSRAKGITDKGYDSLPHFGAGKDIQRDRTDRLFDELLSRGALKERLVGNMQGFNNANVEVSNLMHQACIRISHALCLISYPKRRTHTSMVG
ncbi:ATP-dependent DNA helicase [Schizopora paradoxa]|uniref:ATP-dependent DNA helicase n=1 Tax=Schizopora paradoxa TaxID=27342 RepID=A0A0H2RU28_9AGAM|nr:ATP-dependent DNA helicase [Schizopora paradoxa]